MTKNQTIISTIVSAIVAIFAVLKIFGVTIFDNVTAEQITAIVTAVVLFGTMAWDIWKNHNFTTEGLAGTIIAREMKANRNTVTETVEEPADSNVEG